MKYIKLFESEYWEKVLRLRDLGLSDQWTDKLVDWLEQKRKNPDLEYDSLDLTGCRLKELPPGTERINKSLFLKGSLIERLPAGMEIGGSLWISDCPELRELPRELLVGDNLSVSRCPKLETLPASLRVGNDLSVIDTPIRTLPESASIGGRVSMMDTFVSRNEFTDWVRETGALEPFHMGEEGPQQGARPV